MATPRGAEARRVRTRAAIMAAATPLFLRHGFLGTNMDAVAAAAGVSKQTVYAHFRDKETLFLEIVREMTGAAADTVETQVVDPPETMPLAQFLLDFAATQLSIVMTPRLMQLRRLVIGEAQRFPDLGRALYDQGPGRSIRRLEKAFAGYAARGVMAAEDVHAAASFFNWLVMGAPVNDAMLLGDDTLPGDAAMEAHAWEAVRIFLAAYGVGEEALDAVNGEPLRRC